MGSPAYNGWIGKIRDIRGNKFYADLKKGDLPVPEFCFLCGAKHQKDGWNTYHAEEYGSTWETYVEITKPLCPTCHGMMHVRYKLPNRFKRMKRRVAEGNLFELAPRFANLGAFFPVASRLKDIPYFEDAPSGNSWLDSVQLTAYKGTPKIATIMAGEDQLPDPAIYGKYGKDWTTLSGVILQPDSTLVEVCWD